MARAPLGRLTIRTALVVGFGLTVGLWLFTGYDMAARMSAVEDDSAAITARYMQAQERLSTVRAQVLVASVHVRDALLDSDRGAAGKYRQQLDDTYVEIDRALEQYVPVIGTSSEREQAHRLRRQLDEFRTGTRAVLATKDALPELDARTLLNRHVVPRREAAIRVSEEIQTLNRAAFVRHQNEITSLHRVAERQTWEHLGVALIGSLGIALAAGLYAGRLEERLRRQMTTNDHNTRHLQHLSTRVISAQEEERRTIARELHDEVGQVLTAVKVELVLAQRAINDRGGPAHLLDEAQSVAATALQTVRDLSQLLHPALLDDLGLSAAIDWYASTFGRRHGVKVEVYQDRMTGRLPPEIELATYRIVQEALTNVAKHAQATTCQVSLRRFAHDLEIQVDDDGAGFDLYDLGERPRPGLGLVGMRERAAQFSGKVALESTRGAGTRLKVRLPIRPPARPADLGLSDTTVSDDVTKALHG